MKNIFSFALTSIAMSFTAQAFEPLPANPPIPADNPMTAAKIELGKQLFFDPRLSIDGTISCNSCHNVMSSGTDNRSVSVGVAGAKGGRSAPTVWNAAFLSAQFWDGRAATLEDQAKGPILAHVEMAMPSADAAVKRIKSIPGYVQSFKAVFAGEDPVTYDNMAKAIATYERTLITPNSPFDRYMRGDKTAMTDQAVRGMKTAESVGCTSCHNGPNFSGPALPAGTPFLQKFPTYSGSSYEKKYDLASDLGRYGVTKDASDKNMWRVPTWRNVAITAPYFHNGKVETLSEAIRVMAKTQLNKDLSNKQVADIEAFLHSLTGEFPVQTFPRLPDYAFSSIVEID
ncbi:MAG: cytochrome-c peroxidase [Gammaproteobacteria bacterium]|nr:cytochrome-c peroxidase [Gammaproteobacteria bacterium]MDH5728766.1 cytochrome-c peroxidase [Gammaproteobacteria bacterium]